MNNTHTLRLSLIPQRRLSTRAHTRRAARLHSPLAALLAELGARREKLLPVYERLLARSQRVQARLHSVTRRLASVDRAIEAIEERRI